MKATAIETFKISRRGKRGFIITMPSSYVKNNSLQAGDRLVVAVLREDPSILVLQPERIYAES